MFSVWRNHLEHTKLLIKVLMNWIMELFIKVSGQKMAIEKAKELKFGKMAASMLVTGKLIKPTVRVGLSMLMVTYMKVNGIMTKHRDTALMNMLMELNTLETGKKIDSTDMELRHGLITLAMKVTTNMERSTVSVPSNGLMAHLISVNFTTITSTEKAFILGLTTENLKEIGEPIKCMEKVLSNGPTVESTLASMLMIRKKAMENLSGPMVDATEESGLMENSMARELTSPALVKRSTENGKTVKESDGLAEVNKIESKIAVSKATYINFYVTYNTNNLLIFPRRITIKIID